MSDLATILKDISLDERLATDHLLPIMYEELRTLAARKMAAESADHTLGATALVHEAWLRIAGGEEEQQWNDQQHFFAVAANAMRHILIDTARRKQSQKRGSGQKAVQLLEHEAQLDSGAAPDERLLLMDEALQKLATEQPDLEQVVTLRFYAGLTYKEIAPILNISERTARRNFVYARAWLRSELLDGK